MLNYHRERFRNLLSKFFTVVIQPLSTRLIKPNFCFPLPRTQPHSFFRNPFVVTEHEWLIWPTCSKWEIIRHIFLCWSRQISKSCKLLSKQLSSTLFITKQVFMDSFNTCIMNDPGTFRASPNFFPITHKPSYQVNWSCFFLQFKVDRLQMIEVAKKYICVVTVHQ